MPPRVDEHQRGAMRRDQLGEPVVVLLPDLVRHHRVERRARQLDAEVHRPRDGLRHDGAGSAARSASPTRSSATSSIGFCVADRPMPQQRLLGDLLQALERQRKVGAAPRADHRVDFVDDDRAHRAQHLAAALRRQQQVSDSGVVTRMCGGVRSIAARSDCVVSPVRTAAVMRGGCAVPPASASCRMPRARLREVLVDVGAQRLQRRDVDDAHFVGERPVAALLDEVVEGGEKRGERLARAGRRGDQRVAAVADRRPAARCAGVGSPSVSANHRGTSG